ICPIVLFARELKCRNARDVGAKSQNLQVEHQLGVIGKLGRNTHRPFEVGSWRIRGRTLRTLDLPLDIADTLEIVIQASAIGSAHTLLESCDVHAERIQQASAIAQSGTASGGVAALAEQTLEDDARMRLGRKGRRRR